MGSIVAAIGSVFIGGVVATTTIIGVVSSQTGAPEQSPVSINAATDDIVAYGSN